MQVLWCSSFGCNCSFFAPLMMSVSCWVVQLSLLCICHWLMQETLVCSHCSYSPAYFSSLTWGEMFVFQCITTHSFSWDLRLGTDSIVATWVTLYVGQLYIGLPVFVENTCNISMCLVSFYLFLAPMDHFIVMWWDLWTEYSMAHPGIHSWPMLKIGHKSRCMSYRWHMVSSTYFVKIRYIHRLMYSLFLSAFNMFHVAFHVFCRFNCMHFMYSSGRVSCFTCNHSIPLPQVRAYYY